MTKQELKTQIINKYGSIQRFLLITDLKYHNFNWMINNGKIEELQKLVQKTDDCVIEGHDLTEKLRSRIRLEILKRYKSISEFGRDQGFYDYWLSQVINGHVTRITTKVKKLLSILSIEYYDESN